MRVTYVQLDISGDSKGRKLERALSLLADAPASDLILLPELWTCGYFAFDRYERDSEPVDGPTVDALAAVARERSCHVLTGSFVERDGERLFNTSVLLGPDGSALARYRKMHLFGYQSREQALLTPGDEVVVAPTPWGPAGLATCYDLRFPELFRAMADRGARLFLVVSAWPRARLDAWRLFCRARAHENLAFLFACNCAGGEGDLEYGGHSLCVDPYGAIVAEGEDGQCLLSAEVAPDLVDAARREFSALEDRRLPRRGE